MSVGRSGGRHAIERRRDVGSHSLALAQLERPGVTAAGGGRGSARLRLGELVAER